MDGVCGYIGIDVTVVSWKCCHDVQANHFDFVLVSVHLKATGLHNEDLNRLKVVYYAL